MAITLAATISSGLIRLHGHTQCPHQPRDALNLNLPHAVALLGDLPAHAVQSLLRRHVIVDIGLSHAAGVIFSILAMPATLNVDYYMSYFFRHPHPAIAFPSPMTITVIGDLSPATAGNLGSRTAISLAEPRHALIFAIASAVDAGLSTSELLSWNTLIVVSSLITFQTCHRLAINQRPCIDWCPVRGRLLQHGATLLPNTHHCHPQ
jgi:hypothetical protein